MQLKVKPIALTGFMGSGKSTVGKALARRLGWKFIDLDASIVERCGKSIPEIFASGEAAFREAEFKTLEALIREEQEPVVIALGGGCITHADSRELILSRCTSIYLHASLDCIRKRIGDSDSNRPLFSNADKLYAEREPIYQLAEISVETDETPVHEIIDRIVKILEID